MKKKDIAPIILLAVITLALYLPTMRWLYRAWLHNEYYSHGLLLLPVSLLFIWLARKRIRQAPVVQGNWGTVALVLACSLYLYGFMTHQTFILAFSLLFYITALSIQFLGIEKTKPLLFPIFLLATAIPIPSFYELGIWLQDSSASSASSLTSFFGMDVSSSGNSITIGSDTYDVALACSGLNRIMPLFSLTAILAYVLPGHILKRLSLLALVIPFALFSNIIRITITLFVGSTFGADAALGFFHDFSSIVLFILALAPIILIAYLMKILRLRGGVLA